MYVRGLSWWRSPWLHEVWTETGTENGWIHAELASNQAPKVWLYAVEQAKLGWLPQCILKELPEGQRWMPLGRMKWKTSGPRIAKQKWQAQLHVGSFLVSIEARDESQCSVEVGEFCLVWVSSLTKEGPELNRQAAA